MRAKEFLSQRGVPYVEKRVDQDRQAAIEMIRRSGQQGVPVIVIDDQVVVGFNKGRLEQLVVARQPPPAPPAERVTAHPGLGAQVADAATIALRRGGPVVAGAYVGGVRPGSPAEQAGLRPGDIITAVGDHPVRVADDVAQALTALPVVAATTLTVLRGGEPRTLRVQFGEPAPPGSAAYQYVG